jgi:Chaperone of endosialidase
VNIGFDFRRGPTFLPDALEYFAARVNVLWAKEHDSTTGAHTNITADTIVVGDLTVDSITIQEGSPDIGSQLTLAGPDPWLRLKDTDAAAAHQQWEMRVNGGPLTVSTLSDDGTTRTLAAQWTRSGTTPFLLALETPLRVLSDGAGTAVTVRGRASDSLGRIRFVTSDMAAIICDLEAQPSGNVLRVMFPSGERYWFLSNSFHPYPTKTANLGEQTSAWSWVHAEWLNAVPNGGHIFGGNAGIGMVKSGTNLVLTNTTTAISINTAGAVTMPAVLTVLAGVSAYADAGGFAVKMFGRASDNFGILQWWNNAGTQAFCDLRSWAAGVLALEFPSGRSIRFEDGNVIRPDVTNTGQLGLPSSYWSEVRAYWYHAPTNYGLVFNNNTAIGVKYDGNLVLWNGNWGLYVQPSGDVTCSRFLVANGGITCATGSTAGPGFNFVGDYTTGLTTTAAGQVLIVTSGVVRANFYGPANGCYFTGNVMPNADGGGYLGYDGTRWISVWATNGTIQTSDLRDKTDVGENPYGLDFIRQVETIAYHWKGETNPRPHYGVAAQQLETIGFDAVQKPESESGRYGLNYSELIAPLIRAVQELDAKVTRLCEPLH